MSINVMNLVWERAPFEGGALLVMLALADWANDEGVCWPSVPTIAHKARMKDRNARYVLNELVVRGWLTKDEARGRNHSNTYHINLQKLQALPKRENPQNLQVKAEIKPAICDTKPAICDIKPAIAIAAKPSIEPSVEPREQRARDAIAVFSEIYGHAPHLPGQAEIEGADVDDLELFRTVAKQCHANLTPAKNVGTICRMYKEQRQRALDDEKRRAARASPSAHSPPAKLARVEACSLCDSNGQREVKKDGKRFMVKCKHEGLTDESKHAA